MSYLIGSSPPVSPLRSCKPCQNCRDYECAPPVSNPVTTSVSLQTKTRSIVDIERVLFTSGQDLLHCPYTL